MILVTRKISFTKSPFRQYNAKKWGHRIKYETHNDINTQYFAKCLDQNPFLRLLASISINFAQKLVGNAPSSDIFTSMSNIKFGVSLICIYMHTCLPLYLELFVLTVQSCAKRVVFIKVHSLAHCSWCYDANWSINRPSKELLDYFVTVFWWM